MARIDNLTIFLTDIAESIRGKTGKTDAIPANEFDAEIESISGSEDLTEELTTYNSKVTEQETSIQDIVTALKSKGAGEVQKYAPRWISFYEYQGTELTQEISNLDTSNMTSMYYMFFRCINLTELDLSNFDTSNVTNISKMFYGCDNLKKLDVRTFEFTKFTNSWEYEYTFGYNASYDHIPFDCLVIVKDEANKEWVVTTAKKCSITLSNVKTVAELEGV